VPALAGGRAERLFIGVPVPEATRLSLMRQIPATLPGRATPAENWHFTLRFLGSTDAAHRDRLIDALRAKRFGSAFEIEFDSLGAFPNPRRARVLWVGVGNGHEKLESLAQKAEAAAIESGYEAEARKFTAHLTISRMKEAQPVTDFLTKARSIHAVMRVSDVVLFKSEPGSGHSRYTVVAAFPLK
jgi:RNA 2',3'-cyclic 3'-phosphodiesterase